MSSELEDLLAKQAITEVLHRYCRGMDRIDRDLARSCWHDGGTADYGDVFHGTGAEFVEWVSSLHEQMFISHSHQVTNVLVDLDGDHAASECYVTVALQTADDRGQVSEVVARGRYLDRWSRRSGVWAIDHRRHVADLQTMGRVDSAVPGSGRRDRGDPSYDLFDHA